MTQLRSVTCHMGSHSVTCHPTQANTPRLNPSHTGQCSIYLPRRDGRWVDLVDLIASQLGVEPGVLDQELIQHRYRHSSCCSSGCCYC